MISLDDLTTPVTKEEAKASIYNVLAIVGVNTTSWKPGAVVRTIIAACAILFAALSQLTALIARSGFLELSSGNWLTLVARHVYGVERTPGTFAAGEITLTNTGGGVYTADVSDLIFSNPTTGKTYRNTGAVSLGASSTLTIPIAAVEVGAASSAAVGAITDMETPLLGVTVLNAATLTGLDEESDQALRARCLEKLGSLSPNGPWDAYAYAARNAVRADGSTIGITRTRIVRDGYGNLTTYCATASGAVSGTAGDVTTDLGAVNQAIQTKAAPLGVTATTVSATAVITPITYQAWVYNTVGMSDQQLKDAIATRFTALFAAQPIGGNVIDPDMGKLFVSTIRATIGATRDEIFHVSVSAPAADVELAASEVATLGAITGTITQVVPPEGF